MMCPTVCLVGHKNRHLTHMHTNRHNTYLPPSTHTHAPMHAHAHTHTSSPVITCKICIQKEREGHNSVPVNLSLIRVMCHMLDTHHRMTDLVSMWSEFEGGERGECSGGEGKGSWMCYCWAAVGVVLWTVQREDKIE